MANGEDATSYTLTLYSGRFLVILMLLAFLLLLLAAIITASGTSVAATDSKATLIADLGDLGDSDPGFYWVRMEVEVGDEDGTAVMV